MKSAVIPLLIVMAGCASGPRTLPECTSEPVPIGSIADPMMPTEIYDDGVQTFVRFPGNAELPTIYYLTGDPQKPEALTNKAMRDDGLIVIDRIATGFVFRAGSRYACVVNAGYSGGGAERLPTGTTIPGYERVLRGRAAP